MRKTKQTETVDHTLAPRREFCNVCLGDTNQDVLYSKSIRRDADIDEDGRYGISESQSYSLIQCNGCDNVRMLLEHWFSEETDENGYPIVNTEYHPPNVLRQIPDWTGFGFAMMHSEIRDILLEIYRAIGVNSVRLAMMGIRALVERMMIEKVTDNGSFEKNVKAFFEAGYVAGFQQPIFKETLLEAGHAAMHREWEPSPEDVNTLLDIVEALVKAIYVDPANAEKVSARIPKRITRKNP